jgi:hypothetical protein
VSTVRDRWQSRALLLDSHIYAMLRSWLKTLRQPDEHLVAAQRGQHEWLIVPATGVPAPPIHEPKQEQHGHQTSMAVNPMSDATP